MKDDFLFLPLLERDRDLHGRAGIEPGADPAGEPHAAQAAGLAGVPLRPRNSVRSPVTVRTALAAVDEDDLVGELGVVGVAGEERAADRIEFRDHVHAATCRAVRPAPIPSSR